MQLSLHARKRNEHQTSSCVAPWIFLERIMYLLCVYVSPCSSPHHSSRRTARSLSTVHASNPRAVLFHVQARQSVRRSESRHASRVWQPSLLFAVKPLGRFLATLSRRQVGGLWCYARCVEQAWKRHGVGSVTVQRIKSHESLEGSEPRDQMSLLGMELSSILRVVSRRNGNCQSSGEDCGRVCHGELCPRAPVSHDMAASLRFQASEPRWGPVRMVPHTTAGGVLVFLLCGPWFSAMARAMLSAAQSRCHGGLRSVSAKRNCTVAYLTWQK